MKKLICAFWAIAALIALALPVTSIAAATEPVQTEILVESGCGAALLPMTLIGTLAVSGIALTKKKKRK